MDPFGKTDHFSMTNTMKSIDPMNTTSNFNKLDKNKGLDIGIDFVFNPKKFFCSNHPALKSSTATRSVGIFTAKCVEANTKTKTTKY